MDSSITPTSLVFVEAEQKVIFTSSDSHNSEYPDGTYTVRVSAVAGTSLDVINYVEFTMELSCILAEDEFPWEKPLFVLTKIIRRDYLPDYDYE